MKRLLEFFNLKEDKKIINNLYDRFREEFPNESEDALILFSCVAGLMARVAHVDFEITDSEKEHMKNALIHWMKIENKKAEILTLISLEELKNLQGMDTRKFCTPLVETTNVDTRFEVLEALFELAAADGEVSNDESNEISFIAKTLNLENKYFIAARANVKDYLTNLKK